MGEDAGERFPGILLRQLADVKQNVVIYLLSVRPEQCRGCPINYIG